MNKDRKWGEWGWMKNQKLGDDDIGGGGKFNNLKF